MHGDHDLTPASPGRPDSDPREIFAFDEWTFEPASGELRKGDVSTVRLQPQPARLLALLLERAGDVVTRDDIVASVWGHTTVEFDQAVNYAVRQIRIALGESATDGRYIETLPRRGYRFLVRVTRHPAGPPTRRRPLRRPVLVAAVLLLATVATIATRGPGDGGPAVTGDPAGAPALAIMTLRHAEDDSIGAVAAVFIAEGLTARLTQRTAGRLRIIGPTTTRGYAPERAAITGLGIELGAAYVLGGSIAPERPDGLFLELIDARDGAHLWAMTAHPDDSGVLDAFADSIVLRFAR
jgi:DNA-binding winged helix-turn-helix (wHTH) protein/TolB-like protein